MTPGVSSRCRKGPAPSLEDCLLDKRQSAHIHGVSGRLTSASSQIPPEFSSLQDPGGPGFSSSSIPSCSLPAEGVMLEFPFGSSPFRPACTPVNCRRTGRGSTVPDPGSCPALAPGSRPQLEPPTPLLGFWPSQACKPSPAGPERRSRLQARQALSASC